MNIKRIKDEGLYRRADVIIHRLLDYLADEKTSHIGVRPALTWVEVAFFDFNPFKEIIHSPGLVAPSNSLVKGSEFAIIGDTGTML